MSDEKRDQAIDVEAEAEDLIETTILPDEAAVDASAAAESANPGEDSEQGSADEDPLAKATAQAEENWNKYLRVVAELDNLRKRSARDVEKARLYGVEKLAGAMLEVADSLEMALEVGDKATAGSLLEGNQATLKLLQNALEKHGVEPVYPEGEPFDPEFHEAMSVTESTTAEPDSVVTVVQRGYQLNGRLLRPARVVVARAPDKT